MDVMAAVSGCYVSCMISSASLHQISLISCTCNQFCLCVLVAESIVRDCVCACAMYDISAQMR